MTEQAAHPLTIHMIGNAHIDPVWLWPMAEGRAEVLSTYRTAIMMLNEFDSYVFTSGGSITYQWVEEDDPELFAAIQKAVAAGRWALVNGWWLQPDCNIPAGESFARQALYGQRYLLRAFGQRATVGYNVDSFGHAGTLPQLLKLSGLNYYVFFRPGPHEKTLPGGPFWWEAPGGQCVLACRPPLHYPSAAETDMLQRVQEAAALAPAGQPSIMCFYGVGNHGGGPTRYNVAQVSEIEKQDPALHPVFSSPDRYFAEMTATGQEWPVVAEELQHHARGCYTALSRVKRENREIEHKLMAAERLSTLAYLLAGQPDEQQRLTKAWQGVLFNQFHDIMAGTSIRSAYDDVWNTYEQARQTCQEISESAKTALQSNLEVANRDRPFIIWNTLPWRRKQAVQFDITMGGWHYDWKEFPGKPQLTDAFGNRMPTQLLGVEFDYNSYVVHAEALVDIPPLGAKVVYLDIPQTNVPVEAPTVPVCTILENEYWQLRFDPLSGTLVSLFDRVQQVEMLSGQAGVPLVIDDPSDTWSHDIVSFRNECGRFTASQLPVCVYSGSTRQTIRICTTWGSSNITLTYTLRPGQKAIELDVDIDWHEQLKMLKLAFPLAVKAPRVTAAAPYGAVERQPNGEEEPCQAWIDLSGDGAKGLMGLSLVTDSKYGYDALGNELRLSLLRSPIYAFHDPRKIIPGVDYHFTDQGQQSVHCLLLPHAGAWQTAQPDRQSFELLEPLQTRTALPHLGNVDALSLLQVEPANIVLSVVKLAEDSKQLLVRGYETSGRGTEIVVTAPAWHKNWSVQVAAHEIWTLALPLDGAPASKLNILEDSPAD
ncbi:MAG: glycosyl hydrolase-related protein [Chloroflexi bacterium]|nr:glycosyl hydrolase-related protein [Chloroflexota bacterium]